jgi:hypothetical protein
MQVHAIARSFVVPGNPRERRVWLIVSVHLPPEFMEVGVQKKIIDRSIVH